MREAMGKWDIIILTETHLPQAQEQEQQPWSIESHQWYYKARAAHSGDRQTRTGRAHGGVAVGVRHQLVAEAPVRQLKVERDDVLWLELNGNAFGLDRQLFVVGAYIPPVGSVQHSRLENGGGDGAFDALTKEILTYAARGYVLVAGGYGDGVARATDRR